jgi:hypothetical protein
MERLDSFRPAAPKLVERRGLLRRTDTKFITQPEQIPGFLRAIKHDYGVLKAGEVSLAEYKTVYFDTPNRRCYHDHRRGRRARHKVRIRHYPDRQLSYLEVKTKTNGSVTVKHRSPRAFSDNEMSSEDWAFVSIHTDLPTDTLEPLLWVEFRRLTLVGLDIEERITIDRDLVFRSAGSEHRLPGVAVIEVKQQPYSGRTPSRLALRRAGIRPASISKYCVGTLVQNDDMRSTCFAQTLRRLERLRR